MPYCKIHNVRLYKPEARAIYCMALQENTKRLAVSRSDGSLELWNLNDAYFIEKSIPPDTHNFSVEGIAWCGDKLFSVGLHGLLIEYDLYSLSIKNRLAVTGVAAYCLDVDKTKTLIAIGTEQGYLNIFRITQDEVLFEKFFDKQEGRILCLKFDSTGEFVVSGGLDAIRIWNVQSGHAIHRMTLGQSETNKPTIVWCLAVTRDFSILSGDSRGKLTVWDGKVGGQIESYQSHKADILSICLNEDETSLYCAGTDPNITNYVKINVKGETHKWVKSIQRKIHDHDVRALTLCDNKLYSGGVDGYLACSFHPPKTLIKLPPILQAPCCYLAKGSRCLALRHPKHLEVWSLGKPENRGDGYTGALNLVEEPKKLLVLQKVTKNMDGEEDREGIYCCGLSDDGRWVGYSTKTGVKLFRMVLESDNLNLIKISDLEHRHKLAVQMIFSADNKRFVIAQNTGEILMYDLVGDKASLSHTVETHKEIKDTVTYLTMSKCGKYLAVGDPLSNIAVWENKSNNWTIHCKLPKYNVAPTALAINPNVLNLVVVYADNTIIEYDIRKKQLTEFSRQIKNSLPNQLRSKYYPIRSITFDKRNKNIIILQDDSNIIVVNKEKKSVKSPVKSKKAKPSDIDNNENDESVSENFCSILKRQKHLVYLSWLSDDEMVAVEVQALNLLEDLPPAFAQATFGQK